MSKLIRKIAKIAKNNKKTGQGMVEFALILPVILVSLFVIIELARVLHAWLAIENGARIGVRYAVTGEYDPTYCSGGYSGLECNSSGDEPPARVKSIHDASWAGSTSIVRVAEAQVTSIDPSYFQVTVCDPATVVGPLSTFGQTTCPGGEDPGDPGDRVTVVVEFNHPIILPGLSSLWPQLRLTATRDATVETFRVSQDAGAPPTVVAPPIPITSTPPATITPIPKPECSEIKLKNFTFKDNSAGEYYRFYTIWQDNNPEDGYITKFTLEFPDLSGGYVDYMDYNPDANNTDWEFDIISSNQYVPFSIGFPAPNNFWLSPGGIKSRISVGFDGLSGTLPNGMYKLTIHVEYPGFTVECDKTAQKNAPTTPGGGGGGGGGSGDDSPTPEFPPTSTPVSTPGPQPTVDPND